MSVKGVPKFDSITMGDLTADFKKATISLSGVAAFVDSESGQTHGWTKGEGPVWSKDTMLKLQDLKESMERDLAKVHMSEDTIRADGDRTKPGLEFPSGIGEHVGVDAPAV